MPITIERKDVPFKAGKITTYWDLPPIILEDLACPCCGKPMHYAKLETETGRDVFTEFTFSCSDCNLAFTGLEDAHMYLNVQDFHAWVKSRLELRR